MLDAVGAGLALEVLLIRDGDPGAHARVAGAVPSTAAPPAARSVARAALEGAGTLATTPPVIAVAQRPAVRGGAALEAFLADLDPERLLVLGVAGVADPGNLGALARSAEAAGASAVVVAEGGARPFTGKALRGSMGSLLRLPVFEIDAAAEAIEILGRGGVSQCTARTRGGRALGEYAFRRRCAVWMTSETGEAPAALDAVDGVTIPMAGNVESLNVNVAGALMLFEVARRWRG